MDKAPRPYVICHMVPSVDGRIVTRGWSLPPMEPAREQSMDYSQLVVVWFQEDFAFPIDPGVREKLCALDWERLAVDDSY